MLGYPKDELLRLTLKNLYGLDPSGAVTVRFESLIKHGNIYFETIHRARDDSGIPVAINARTQKIGDRRTVMSVVTDRRSIEQRDSETNEIEDRHSFLASETGQFICDGVLNPYKVTCYGGTMNVLGYTSKELEAFTFRQWRKLCHVDDLKKVLSILREAVGNVSTYSATYRLRKRSGEWAHVEDRGVALPGEDGKAYRVIGNVREITTRIEAEAARRKLDQELPHSQNLESLGVLAGGIAHDFNNILTAIIVLTDMALTDIEPKSKIYEELREALQAAHRAKELVKQIHIHPAGIVQ